MPGGRADQVGRFGPTGRSPRARAAGWGSADVGDKRGEREPDQGDHEQRGEQSADPAVHARFLLSRVVVGACPTSSPLVMEPVQGVVTWSSSRVDIWLFRSAAVLDHDEDREAAQEDRVDVGEVDGEDRVGLRG